VLNSLAETAGFPIPDLPVAGGELRYALAIVRANADKWKDDRRQRWLELIWTKPGQSFSVKSAAFLHEDSLRPTPGAVVAITLNLSAIWARLKMDNTEPPGAKPRRRKK
jgi:hypothetical protein